MKKILAMLLALVMLLCLCACNSADAPETEPSEDMTQSTEASTDTSDPTEESGEAASDPTEASGETASDPTEAPAPTEAPTTPAPAPAGCSHSWKAATCTAPKTCTKCGAKEGGAAGHNWKAATCTAPKTCTTCGATEGGVIAHNYANGACTMCGAVDPQFAYNEFVKGVWKCEVVKPATADTCETYFVVTYDPGWDFGYSYKTYFSELPPSEGGDEDGEEEQYNDTVQYNGKTYYDLTFSGSMGGWTPTALPNGNVKIEMMNEVTLEVKRDAPGKFSVVSINDTGFLPVGAVLNKTRDA